MKKGAKKDNGMVLAIDPGTTQSAYVIFDSNNKEITAKGIEPNENLIPIIRNTDFDGLTAIEMISSYGMPVGKEVFETCLWIGRYYQTADDMGHELRLVYRKDVKMYLCNSVKAKDANIRQALIDMLGKDVTKGVSKDVWAALAVAVTVSRTEMVDR